MVLHTQCPLLSQNFVYDYIDDITLFGIPLVARIVTTVPNALFFYFQCSEDVTQLRYVEDIQPNTVHMAWQIPQYFLLTCGEVVFSVTGLEFSYSQVGFALQLIHVLAQDS